MTTAWGGHIPFAYFIMAALNPEVFVELGTHKGASYWAFCQSIELNKLTTKCFAVDTWAGDEHAGQYSDEIYGKFKRYHDRQPWQFSTLLRMTFDQALDNFADRSIDLLHIDGFHTYEAVKHDFETWRPKLSDQAVVLFHDVANRKEGFGVWRLMEELRKQYPYFEFEHSSGLGVLGFGENLPEEIGGLFQAMTDQDSLNLFKKYYQRLGESIGNLNKIRQLNQDLAKARETESATT